MAVMIGNAVCDEHGKAKGGQPGNQTGKELRIQAWYLNKKGWVVLRPKSPEVAEKLAQDCRWACENMAIGYNQSKRNTLYTAAKPLGFNCKEVVTLCECDCSSLVRVCCMYAGVKVNDFNTASEVTRLMATGAFEKLTDSIYTEESAYLKCGDVLVTKTKGHTAIVLNDGPKAAPTPDPEPEPGPEPEPPTPPEPEPPEPKTQYVLVVGGSVRVHKYPRKLSKTLWIAHNARWYKVHHQTERADMYKVLDIDEESGWYHIQVLGDPSHTGWITNKEKYVKLLGGEK